MSNKQAHAAGWGIGGTALTIGAGVGMVFTGPIGWVVFGIVAGIGSSTVVSSIQQGCDSSKKDFSYKTLATDAAIGGTLSMVPCGVGGAMAATSSLAAKEGSKLVLKEVGKNILRTTAK